MHSAMNIGLLYFRHSPNTTAFINAWAAALEADPSVWDQNQFNWLAHQALTPFRPLPANDRLVGGWVGGWWCLGVQGGGWRRLGAGSGQAASGRAGEGR